MSYFDVKFKNKAAILTLNQPDSKVNTLNEALINSFSEFLDSIEKDPEIRGAVIISGKENNFIAGADIEMFRARETAGELKELSRQGHSVLDRMEVFPKPVVAAVHGSCVGGGLELALACSYRIASNHPRTAFSLPEVQLGILPGTGGTQRLPRLVGIQKALEYMLTGKNIYAKQAKRIGLADELVHRHALETAAVKAVLKLSEKGGFKRKDRRSFTEKLLEGNAAGRALIFSQAVKKVKHQTRGNYPAPPKIIEAVKYGYKHGKKKGLLYESELFGELGVTPESRELVNLFFRMNDAKKNPLQHLVRPVQNAAVLGAGLMGAGIADVSINRAGMNVLLKDRDLEAAARGEKAIWKALDNKVKKKIISKFERDKTASQVTGTASYEGFGKADLVIEAVFEDLSLKQKMVAETEAVTRSDCIFATNTSSLPIAKVAEKAERPQNIIGMHYFSPVPKMPLLEIITTPQTADWVTATAFDVGVRQGKTVIVVKDGPGFYTTRILAPYINEALLMLEEGAAVDFIDNAMKDFGFPVGPLALLDEVGFDVGAHVAETMKPLFSARGAKSSDKAQSLVDAGFAGRKNGKGFYTYGTGKKKTVNTEIYSVFGGAVRKNPEKMTVCLRVAYMMINEAVYCLQENIIRSAEDGDIGAVMGLGFPPFTGGPFRYIHNLGVQEFVKQMKEFEKRYGPRFRPAPLAEKAAAEGKPLFKQ